MNTEPTRILLVCDDTTRARGIIETLEGDGHRLEHFRASRQALEGASDQPFTLVMIDLGFERDPAATLRLMRAELGGPESSPTFIGIAGHDEQRLIDQALAAGLDEVVCIPVSPSLVRRRVAACLESHRLRKMLQEQQTDLDLILNLTWRIEATGDLREILFELVHHTAGAMGIERCSLILTDAGSRRGVVLATSDDPKIVDLEIDLDRYPEIEEALSSGEDLILERAADHPLLASARDKLVAQEVGALAVFPLQHHDEPVGVLLMRDSASRGPFSARAISLARTLARTTAIALRNAQTFDQIRRETLKATEGKAQAEREVADLRQMEAELRETKDFLENLIDASTDAIVAADMKGRILVWNKTAERLLGYTREEACAGLHVSDIYHDDARAIMAALRSDEAGGKGRLEETTAHVLSRSKERIPVTISASLLLSDGREVASVGLLTDVRERLRIEEKLSAAQERLMHSERASAIAALAGTTAHELNQPLTSIMGYAELLQYRLPDDDANTRAVGIIVRESERMAKIVRKIGRITKFETKDYLGETRIVDLDASVDDEED